MTVEDLYSDTISAFGLGNTPDNERLFLSSLQSVVTALNRKLNLSVTAPTEIDSSDIGFESYCDAVFYAGVKYYLQRLGRFAQDPDSETSTLYNLELSMVIGAAIAANEDFETRNQ